MILAPPSGDAAAGFVFGVAGALDADDAPAMVCCAGLLSSPAPAPAGGGSSAAPKGHPSSSAADARSPVRELAVVRVRVRVAIVSGRSATSVQSGTRFRSATSAIYFQLSGWAPGSSGSLRICPAWICFARTWPLHNMRGSDTRSGAPELYGNHMSHEATALEDPMDSHSQKSMLAQM